MAEVDPGGGGGVTPKTTTKPPAPAKEPDWAEIFWGSLGLPTEVAGQIDVIFRQYGGNTATAQAVAQQYLRTTDWYKQTFPGIEYGIRNGLFTDETGYRQYVNQVNQLYHQYAGRALTGNDTAAYLQMGTDVGTIGKQLEGLSLGLAQRPKLNALLGAQDEQGTLTPVELAAFGQQQAGLSTPLGQQIAQRIDAAQKRLAGVFQGTQATGSLGLGPQGPFSASLQGQKGTDIAA